MIDTLKDDVDQMYDFGKYVVDKFKSFIDNAPKIAAGLGIASSLPYVGPVARGALKGAAKATGVIAKGAFKLGATAIKSPGKLLLVPVAVEASNVYGRALGSPGVGNVAMGLFTGKLPKADKNLLQRKSFKLNDLFSAHHQLRMVTKVLRPSWFEDEAETSERS